MDVIKSLSQTQDSMTICATIHSPTAHAFAQFGKMIILLQGRMVYFGSVGESLKVPHIGLKGLLQSARGAYPDLN